MPLLGVSGPLPPNLRSLLLVGDFFLGGEPRVMGDGCLVQCSVY
jgi:hypothetical protein